MSGYNPNWPNPPPAPPQPFRLNPQAAYFFPWQPPRQPVPQPSYYSRQPLPYEIPQWPYYGTQSSYLAFPNAQGEMTVRRVLPHVYGNQIAPYWY
ncbi:hypothetical protein MGN70_002797 [Eutypa lata]|nr:hypothetical protein MGN70_002797 [Eutypa lata]